MKVFEIFVLKVFFDEPELWAMKSQELPTIAGLNVM